MGLTVKVMSRGRVIDRIASSVRMESGSPVVSYRERLWPVVNGCINVDEGHSGHDAHRREWAQLVERLLPQPLPERIEHCNALLDTRFRASLPRGVVQAICSLASLRLERQARELLVDFLSEKHDSTRLRRLLQLQLLFMERTGRPEKPAVPSAASIPDAAAEAPPEDSDWLWAAAQDPVKPEVDDTALRRAAQQMQADIGRHVALESGEAIPGFDDPGDASWPQEPSDTPAAESGSESERRLLERTARLGPVALDLLRYFSDNPGDHASHAHQVLGHPLPEINRLLTGSLGHYLRRVPGAGWECHPWAIDVLDALDGAPS